MKKWESHGDTHIYIYTHTFHGAKNKMKLILRNLSAQGVAT